MSTNGEEKTDLVILIDEEGSEHNFRLIDMFQVNLKEYAVLVPYADLEGSEEAEEIYFDEAYIFRVDLTDGEENLVEVEDEEEWDEVASVWEERLNAYEFEDDEELF